MILAIKTENHHQGRVIRFTPGYYNLILSTPEVLVTPVIYEKTFSAFPKQDHNSAF